jgi:cytochrome c oxidase assembly factor CtaG
MITRWPAPLLRTGSIAALALPCVASAHTLSPDATGMPDIGWTFEPWVIALLGVTLGLYGIGYARLRARSRRARGIRLRQLGAFLAGWAMTVVALVSPLDARGAAMFSAHMVQHEVLMLLAAPLLVLGRPLAVWMWALPASWRPAVGRGLHAPGVRGGWRWLTSPAVAWVFHALALWAWHAPPLFEAALTRPGIHTLQHASFFISALFFWWTVLAGRHRQAGDGHAMLSVFTTMMHTGALGALLTLAPGLWYPIYVTPTTALGFDPLQDQQLGGLIMWVPGGLAYFLAGLAIALRWVLDRRPPDLAAGAAAPLARPTAGTR